MHLKIGLKFAGKIHVLSRMRLILTIVVFNLSALTAYAQSATEHIEFLEKNRRLIDHVLGSYSRREVYARVSKGIDQLDKDKVFSIFRRARNGDQPYADLFATLLHTPIVSKNPHRAKWSLKLITFDEKTVIGALTYQPEMAPDLDSYLVLLETIEGLKAYVAENPDSPAAQEIADVFSPTWDETERIDALTRTLYLQVRQFEIPRQIDSLMGVEQIIRTDQKVELDLSYQFPPTTDQYPYGTCWAHAGVAALSAAVFRQTGRSYEISAEYAALCVVIDGLSERDSSGSFDSAKWNYVKYGAIPSDSIVDRGHEVDAINAVLARKEACISSERFPSIVATIDSDLKMIFNEIQEQESADGGLPRERSRRNVLKEFEPVLTKRIHEAVDNYRTQNPSDFLYIAPGYRRLQLFNKDNFWTGREKIEQIVQTLNRGIPVMTSVYGSSDSQVSENGGKTWRRKSIDAHSMVITGYELNPNGVSYFIFRNSWKKGDEKDPHRSLARLPMYEAQRIRNASVVIAPKDDF